MIKEMIGLKNYPILVLAVMLFPGLPDTSCKGIWASEGSVENGFNRGARVMSMDVVVHLFNIRTYKEKVLPAYQVFLRRDEAEPLIALLRECEQKLEVNPRLSEQLLWSKESVEEDIGIITGTVYYSPDEGKTSNQGERQKTHKVRRDYARGLLSSHILQTLCVPRDKGIDPEQDMTNSRLVHYLYKTSQWAEELFTFERSVRGDRLELSIGESSTLFTEDDAQQFNKELGKIAPPDDPELRKGYDNLRAMVKVALEDSDLTLVLSVM